MVLSEVNRSGNPTIVFVNSKGNEIAIFSDACVFQHCKSIHGLEAGINFFKFPVKNEEQCNAWLNICNLSSKPSRMEKLLMCSLHFSGGYPSKNMNDVNYMPTLYIE